MNFSYLYGCPNLGTRKCRWIASLVIEESDKVLGAG